CGTSRGCPAWPGRPTTARGAGGTWRESARRARGAPASRPGTRRARACARRRWRRRRRRSPPPPRRGDRAGAGGPCRCRRRSASGARRGWRGTTWPSRAARRRRRAWRARRLPGWRGIAGSARRRAAPPGPWRRRSRRPLQRGRLGADAGERRHDLGREQAHVALGLVGRHPRVAEHPDVVVVADAAADVEDLLVALLRRAPNLKIHEEVDDLVGAVGGDLLGHLAVVLVALRPGEVVVVEAIVVEHGVEVA